MVFATIEDIKSIITPIESSLTIQYHLAGLLDNNKIPFYTSLLNTPNLGYAPSGDWNKVDSYLILPKDETLNVRSVPQRAGGIKFAVDQMINPKSIEIKTGGIWENKEHVLVAGQVGTISDDPTSTEIFKSFSTTIREQFSKIHEFFVGEHAEAKLDKGWRLVTMAESPIEYDLKR
jgi:hypothetical protein